MWAAGLVACSGAPATPRVTAEARDAPPASHPVPAAVAARSARPPCPALPELAPVALVPAKIDPALVPMIDPRGSLAPFHAKVLGLLRGSRARPVRIAFYGDSNLTLDLLSGPVRRTLQTRYGDAGHGFVLVGQPWRWYDHLDVKRSDRGPWSTRAPTRTRLADAGYGAGGAVAVARGAGATAAFATSDGRSPVGDKASRFGVFHAVGPRAGSFSVQADHDAPRTVDCNAPAPGVRYVTVDVADGAHRFEVSTTGRGEVRLYGVTLERDVPGFIVDGLGIGGVNWNDLSLVSRSTSEPMLRARPYDLVIFLLGSNTFQASENPAAIRRLVELHRAVAPDVGIVIMTPPDHVARAGDARSDPQFLRIAEAVRRTASELPVALYDFHAAMGGDGAMTRFITAHLGATDTYHLTRSGGEFMAARVLRALWDDLAAYARAHPDAGCPAAQ